VKYHQKNPLYHIDKAGFSVFYVLKVTHHSQTT